MAVRRIAKFGVGTLLILVSICACLIALQVNRAQKVHAVFDLASELGGRIRYDYEPRDPGWASIWMSYAIFYTENIRPKPWGPKWAHYWLGEEYFCRIVAVELSSRRLEPQFVMKNDMEIKSLDSGLLEDSDLTPLRVPLRVLTRSEKSLLKELCSLGQIEHLKFDDVLVDESILAILAECQGLKSLSISPVVLSDNELQKLEECVNLAFVELFEGDHHVLNQVSYKLTTDGPKRLVNSLPGCTVHLREIDSYGCPASFPTVFRSSPTSYN